MKIIPRKGEKNTQNTVNKVVDSSMFYKNIVAPEDETDETLDKMDEDEDVEEDDEEE